MDVVLAVAFWIAVATAPLLAIRFGRSESLGAVRRMLGWSLLGNGLGVLSVVVVATREGRPDDARWLAAGVATGILVWGLAVIALVASTFLGAPWLAGLLFIGGWAFLFIALGRAPARDGRPR